LKNDILDEGNMRNAKKSLKILKL